MNRSQQLELAFTQAENITPILNDMPEFAPTGACSYIRPVWFEGMNKGDKKTKVFAYIGFPENASAHSKVPAIVLVHGGGGHAFLPWVKMWNDRGYAAIAMDDTGYFPTAINAGDSETCKNWEFGLPEYLKEPDYTDAPNNDDLTSSANEDVSTMWMYHAVGQAILAVSILRADERVESSKVGLTGISWGGLITSITMGYDDRLAFAIPVYCTGYSASNPWGGMKERFSRDNGTAELWSPEARYDKVKMPVLWSCWNDDNGMSVQSNSLSYLDGVKNNPEDRLSIRHMMFHSHSCSWCVPENMAFADSVVKGGARLTGIENNTVGRSISLTLTPDSSAEGITATVFYLTKEITHSRFKKYHYDPWHEFLEEYWNTAPLTVEGNKVSGEVPADALSYYVEIKTLIGGTEYVTSSVYTEL